MDNFLKKWADAYEVLGKCTTPVSAFTKAFEMTQRDPQDAPAHREALLDVCVEKKWMSSKHAHPLYDPNKESDNGGVAKGSSTA